ncbi:hypothetical protein BH09BAC2_BH09BAC2_01980 [soil metagenome]
MSPDKKLYERLKLHADEYHPVVLFKANKERLIPMDFTEANVKLKSFDLTDTELFSSYINEELEREKATFGIGGYNENRTVYQRSSIFSGTEPRTVHLGTDIWGKAETKVYAPLGGMIHSLGLNNNFGDYGATIILLHQLDGIPFYTLYGHLSLQDIYNHQEGKYISRGELIGHFGKPEENGYWPPHLHFQIINHIGEYKGDYPGVCKLSERHKYLDNCPDPDLILCMNQYISN